MGPYLQKRWEALRFYLGSVSFNASLLQSLRSSPDGESDHSDLTAASVERDEEDGGFFFLHLRLTYGRTGRPSSAPPRVIPDAWTREH